MSQLLIEMCRRELPDAGLAGFDFTTIRQTYDTGPFTIAGRPDGKTAALWSLDPGGNLAMTAKAVFA
jgi:hydroxyacyl-ACP dehydratase HTD2-like protein with hotdog domain